MRHPTTLRLSELVDRWLREAITSLWLGWDQEAVGFWQCAFALTCELEELHVDFSADVIEGGAWHWPTFKSWVLDARASVQR